MYSENILEDTLLHLSAIAIYVVHFIYQLRHKDYNHRLYLLTSLGLLLQLTTLVEVLVNDIGYGFFTIISFSGFSSVFTVLCLQIMGKPCGFLQLWFVPVSCLTLVADMTFTNSYGATNANTIGLIIHVLLSIVALSFVFVNSAMLFFCMVRNYQLKRPSTKQWHIVPAMETAQKLSKIFLFIAWITLTLAVVSGLTFVDDFLEQQVTHKTFFTIVAWCILSAMLLMLRRHNILWVRTFILCLLVNVFLITGYFGSRFALEFILR